MKPFAKPILVTRPYFPPLEEYRKGLEEIWANQWLTNNGPVVQRFQKELATYLGVPVSNTALFVNGTLALEIGFHALGLAGGEVITTPFTFVATSHALRRIGAKPVFADVDPETLCLDPAACEKLITPRTKAIVPVHVYGHPCDVDGFQHLADKYHLKIIYDAAHAFGVKLGGKSIATYGDMAMFSFHPTKLFHSCEGGLLVFKDPAVQERVDRLRNFAILSETECVDVGTNAKMNELQALMGELCLKKIADLLAYRKLVHDTYEQVFTGCQAVKFLRPLAPCSILHTPRFYSLEANYAYCPVLLRDFAMRERVYTELKKYNVFTRRYFYPLLTDFASYKGGNVTPIAHDTAARVLTLPTYYGLPVEDVKQIAGLVMQIVNG
jgi:dTDP-4-amino-4,6-dideoxygalactose transaminase